MKLDRSRKYTFAGDVYEFNQAGDWSAPNVAWTDKVMDWTPQEFQHFADRGLVSEVREAIRGEGIISFNQHDRSLHDSWNVITGLTKEQRSGKTFRVVATEILEGE